MTPLHPTFLVGANRPALGRTLLSALLADWLSTRFAQPCALADGDPLRGVFARMTGRAPATLAADDAIPENAVVDNADALAPAPQPSGGDTRSLASLGRWLTAHAERQGRRLPVIVCALVDDKFDADRAALDALRQTLTDHRACVGMIAVRNMVSPHRLLTQEDQVYIHAGGWPTSQSRSAWLNGGGREWVFTRPFDVFAAQARELGRELSPALASHPGLWTLSRQQAIRWRRDFADRAERACVDLLTAPPRRLAA